ncbi:IS66 family insertion sequence element accessory protein TnpB [Devosia psychrophila]|uniref:IS66 Orf2 like protein n=1 Tax=Devosia psychrophila TaxID=728005 RepID=A0A1I1SDQ1_9HYPH|nr:IS66 family insertion sequence element accessory protein TnpB [Devosia psychrophila]SFD41110.1 IS66 Orf2 like protein [Devosia psychrophila]
MLRGTLGMIPAGVKVFLASHPVDFRKGPDGLMALVRDAGADPFSGALCMFRAKRADRIKIAWWDGTGLCHYAKRLEKASFCWPRIGHSRVDPSPDPGQHGSSLPPDVPALASGMDARQGEDPISGLRLCRQPGSARRTPQYPPARQRGAIIQSCATPLSSSGAIMPSPRKCDNLRTGFQPAGV